MDDSFHYIAQVMPRRRVDPFALRLAAFAAFAVAAVAGFAWFAIQHERAADATAQANAAEREAAAQVAIVPQGDDAETGVFRTLDEEARTAATNALDLAAKIFAGTDSYETAGPAQLTEQQPSLLFVDGPSTSPAIVSVDASETSWAAAVMGPSGDCYWIRAAADGAVAYGTGRACTGADARSADARAW
jgi:hypothetical protein